MMNRILKSISFIFHPLLMPFFGVVFYFYKSPKYLPEDIVYAKLFAVLILTVILPILLYFILMLRGKVKSIHLETTKERILPLFFNCINLILVLKYILSPTQVIELYFFFVGILLSTLTCLILAVLKFKASIHMIAVSGVFMFFIALSIHFNININESLALMVVLIGALATSRLLLDAHSSIELIIGFFIGFIPQLLLVNYWL
ncbi:hypothetical protein APS56_08140 [Pseudalgibacter alginicilyticus]|uniref:Transmembrane protein n=1 Tax=Pseudalgibacter alginicilyticus TaxID=1736674 RepID=A0A0P0D2E7_9FLAO|nr:hypothetical protein [Pseudalgibacter alginicilyticus]ALJ05096.1 hypothetical protein APS56_08140 [Pseudalgibacter alginicilyticus]